MKKQVIFSVCSALIAQNSFSTSPTELKALFQDPLAWNAKALEVKQELDRDLIPLRAISFNGMTIKDINLSFLKLTDINLSGAKLERVALRGSNLQGSLFKNTTFIDCDMANANLSWTTIVNTVFKGKQGNLSNADLRGIVVTDSVIEDNISLENAYISDSGKTNSNNVGQWWKSARTPIVLLNIWKGLRLTAQMNPTNKDNAKWYNIMHANALNQIFGMLKLDFSGQDLTNQDFSSQGIYDLNTFLKSFNFGNANLKNTELRDCILSGCNIQGAKLDNTNLRGATVNGLRIAETWILNKGTSEEIANMMSRCDDPSTRETLKKIGLALGINERDF